MIPEQVAKVLQGPQLSIYAVAEPALALGRAWGARIGDDGQSVRIFVTEHWTPNLAKGAHMAWTLTNPQTAECYQLKGTIRDLVPPTAEDLAVFGPYQAGVVGYLTNVYHAPAEPVARMVSPPHKVAVLDVEAVYLQTPGPKAGTLIAGGLEETTNAS